MSRRTLTPAVLLVALSLTIGLVAATAQASSSRPASVPGAAAPHFAGNANTAAQISSASVIYSNLGPGGAYTAGNGWCVEPSGGGCSTAQSVAMPFTASSGNQITQIDLGLTHYSGTNDAVVQLAEDNGGAPGQVLGSWSVANQPAFGSCCGLTTIHVSPTIGVGAGRKYWVVAYPGAGTLPTQVWNWNYYGYVGSFDIDQGFGWFPVTDYLSAFDVLGCGKLCKVYP